MANTNENNFPNNFYERAMGPDVGIKSCPNFPKVAQKVATSGLT